AALLRGEVMPPRVLPQSLAFNLFPQVDVFMADGYTEEEDKMQFASGRIMGRAPLWVDAPCVRVPFERCHSESVAVQLEQELSVAAARELLARAPGGALGGAPGAQQ